MDDRFVKKCRVCGDKALSFNYDGLCCKSCKIFFRRNAGKCEEFQCCYGGNCPINVITRKNCQPCRLSKCFDIGMKKELIVIKEKHDESLSASQLCDVMIEDLFAHDLPENCESIDRLDFIGINKKTDENYPKQKPYDSQCLETLKKATLLFHEQPRMNVNIVGYANDLVQVFNNQEYRLQTVISFINQIAGFRLLNKQDQLNLFKASFPCMLLLRSAYYFNFEKNAFLTPLNQTFDTAAYVRLDTIYRPDKISSIYVQRKFAFRVQKELESDDFIRDMILVLLVFRTTDNISSLEYVRYQYTSYCHLLRKYLAQKYGPDSRKANEKYLKLLQIVQDIDVVKQNCLDSIFNNVDYCHASDVMAEIYFLKKQQSQICCN